MSYCTVDDVCTAFPRFVRNAANSIQDTQIQDWIDDRKARIRGAFLARLIDPDTLDTYGGRREFSARAQPRWRDRRPR